MKIFNVFFKDLAVLVEVYITNIPYYSFCYGLNECYTRIKMAISKKQTTF